MNCSWYPMHSEVAVGGRVKDAETKKALSKQMSGIDLDAPAVMDLESGAFKVKKPKKEKSPTELASQELKSFEKKLLDVMWVRMSWSSYMGSGRKIHLCILASRQHSSVIVNMNSFKRIPLICSTS